MRPNFLWAFLLLVLSACSNGGGGGGTSTSPPPVSAGGHCISGKVSDVKTTGFVVASSNNTQVYLDSDATSVPTNADGQYQFCNLPDGTYSVYVRNGDGSQSPATSVTIAGADGSADFQRTLAVLADGSVLYPCNQVGVVNVGRLCVASNPAATGNRIWEQNGLLLDTLVRPRNGHSVGTFPIFVTGFNMNGINSAGAGNSANVAVRDDAHLTAECLSTTSGRAFDASPDALYVAVSVPCAPMGTTPFVERWRNIFVVMTDGTLRSLEVTSGSSDFNYDPIFGGPPDANGHVSVFFFKKVSENGSFFLGEIWKQVINPAGIPSQIGAPVRIADQVLYNIRSMSVCEGGVLVYVKDVGGTPHLTSHLLSAGAVATADIDLGQGQNPYCSRDGAHQVLYEIPSQGLFVVNTDGSNRKEVTVPANLSGPPSSVLSGS